MSARTYILVTSVLFGLVAAVHVCRLIWQWDVFIDGRPAPMWMSIIAALVTGYLSFAGIRLLQHIRRFLT